MDMEKKVNKVGFIRFEQDDMGLFPARIGIFGGRRSLSVSLDSTGIFSLKTDEGIFDGYEFQLVDTYEEKNLLKFTFRSPSSSFTLESIWKYDEECNIISRKDVFINSGDELCIVNRFFPKIVFQSGDYSLYTQQSRWGLESQGLWRELSAGSIELSSRLGRWTEGGTPFAVLRTHESKEALAFHVIPNGDYLMRFSASVVSTMKPHCIFQYGLSDEDLEAVVLPGEKLEAPELLIQRLPSREEYSSSAMLHRYCNKYLCPDWKPLPVLYNTWLDVMGDLDVPRMRKQLLAAKKAGSEVFVIDAGWYKNAGDWTEKEDNAFFGKMKEFADEVRKEGLGFGLWIEPEFFSPDCPAVKEHKEFFVTTDGRWKDSARMRMDFTVPGAVDFYYEMIASLIRKYDLAYIKFDMNTTPGRDDTGSALYGYVRGVHEVMGRLRKDYPGTILENCSSGAMRTTLAELPYFDHHFVSDNANILDVLHITQGTSLRMPAGRIMRWLTIASAGSFRLWPYPPEIAVIQPQNATWKHYEETDLNCGILASMPGVLGFSGDFASLKEETLSAIREVTEFYKANREVFQNGEMTLLTPPDGIDHRHGFISFLVSRRESGKHFLFLFYRNCDGASRMILQMPSCTSANGLKKDSLYNIVPHFGNLESAEKFTATGAELASEGIEIPLHVEQHGDFKGCLWEIAESR